MKILRLFAKGMPQSEIAKQCSFQKTKVNYWKQKFLENNLIRVKISGKPIFYDVTLINSVARNVEAYFVASQGYERRRWRRGRITDSLYDATPSLTYTLKF
jgi:DNA-binding transcriptional regulator LsrR (DeoR family)